MFSNFFKKGDNVDYKARLERKMCLAKETPEMIFDLSECNLKNIPVGVFSLCKVFRKEALFLNDNVLTSITSGGSFQDLLFIKILDLHSNKLTKLPDAITSIPSLENLNLADNQLVYIPKAIGNLKYLKNLKLSNNKLKLLPSSIGFCRALQSLDVRGNSELNKLPEELGALSLYILADSNVQLPPLRLIENSAAATASLITSENGANSEDKNELTKPKSVKEDTNFFIIQEKLKLIEERKELEKKHRLDWEKALAEEQIKETNLHLNLNSTRNELIDGIRKAERGFEESLNKIQGLKDLQRLDIISQCLQMENDVGSKVNLILANAKSMQKQMTDMTERERLLEDELLFDKRKQSVALDKSAVVGAMDDLLKEDILRNEKFQIYDNQRRIAAVNWANEQSEWSSKLSVVAASNKTDTQSLTQALLVDEDLQKAAVASLMEKCDTKTWNLTNQVSIIEKQLAELTKMEIERKKNEREVHLTDLCTSRLALTELLMDLFEQQKTRRAELVSALHRMEGMRGDDDGFWLERYQRLLTSSSRQMVAALREVDPLLHHQLALHGVSHCMPLLADQLTSLTSVAAFNDQVLIECGVTHEDDRVLLLKAFSSFLEDAVSTPSAPTRLDEPSAPLLSPTANSLPSNFLVRTSEECVICLAASVNTIFLPCGHMCCCLNCSPLKLCPLCREIIVTTMETSIYKA